jgi:L-alanine-DL-glutamate epimerase-like enolase superfamily enzyme
MKITDVTVFLAKEWRTFLFVVVDTDEGIYGLGEAGITGRELAVQGAIEHFKPLLIGEDPFRIEHIWQMLFRGGFFPAQRILTAAISAIDVALWDIKGKALGVPVYELLGGRQRRGAGRFLPAGCRARLESAALGATGATRQSANPAPGDPVGDPAV